ncbi:MAG TPA: carboxyl transferase domain-containing protein [Microbacterium sp.]|uniref:carboxyl transferase domain-containing protein n=1 Tax=Microbacterium sp. TaxID=51671 RepID=UPI002D1D74ED|nr:carboxyl transferase domain-containing protein [Microbacterium sp.]HWI31474.1 carboxyl transferase domain-containing protein [Microbacterium sp.]
MSDYLSAVEVISRLADEGSFVAWDDPIVHGDVTEEYEAQLRRAAHRTGCDEAVITGSARMGGHRVALIVSEFGFLGGSVGTLAAARIVAAVHRATEEELPLIGLPASGGTRMQDGAAAFAAMVDIATAVRAHALVGLPYFVYLRNPTTGGTLASWGTLGHLTIAEPHAFIGFLGPAVVQAITGEQIDPAVQRSENLFANAQVDLVADIDTARVLLARALGLVLVARIEGDGRTLTAVDEPIALSSWDAVVLSRSDREDANELVSPSRSVFLRGSGDGRQPLLIAMTRMNGLACLVIAHDRRAELRGCRLNPRALRDAQRALRVAEELRLPVVTLIDTAGAELSADAETSGLAAEIAECAAAMGGVSVPSVSVLIGEGAGGGAMALFPAARRLALPAAWFSPLPPEGSSQLMHGTPDNAAVVADAQRIGSRFLFEDGVIDDVIPDLMHVPGAIELALSEQRVRA